MHMYLERMHASCVRFLHLNPGSLSVVQALQPTRCTSCGLLHSQRHSLEMDHDSRDLFLFFKQKKYEVRSVYKSNVVDNAILRRFVT